MTEELSQTARSVEVLRLLAAGLSTDHLLEIAKDLSEDDISVAAAAGLDALLQLRRDRPRFEFPRTLLGKNPSELTPHERLVRKIFDDAKPVRPVADSARPRRSSESKWTPEQVEVRRRFPRAWEPWTEVEDQVLSDRFRIGHTIDDLAADHQRRPSAIRSRLTKLGLA